VVTSVDRDDLPDFGAGIFARTISAIRALSPGTTIEVLTPDFQGSEHSLRTVMAETPEIFNHNVETVPRLYRRVRPKADYAQSLQLLRMARRIEPRSRTKSGFMVGLGETDEEVRALLRDLRGADVTIATVGQYLQPTRRNLPVSAYIEPRQFEAWRDYGLSIGFQMVFSGPLVRSSYMADIVSERATH
jgi:lipoic acid synthetase